MAPVLELVVVDDASGDVWMGTTSDGLLLRVHGDVLSNETTNVMSAPKHIRCLQVTFLAGNPHQPQALYVQHQPRGLP